MSETIKGEPIPDNGHQEFPGTTAVRVYDQANASGDFPVLKAFQEYLEAEQAKAHKRMLALSIFFLVLLVTVVLTFTVITYTLINRGQNHDQKSEETLSTLLMELAKGRLIQPAAQPSSATPIVNVQQPQPAMVPAADGNRQILEKLAAMEAEAKIRAAVADAEARATAAEARARAAEAEARSSRMPPVVNQRGPLPDGSFMSPDSRAKLDSLEKQNEEIKKQQEAIKAQREKLKAEKEALHKEEVEKQRRKMYPEWYAKEDARRAQEEAAKNPPPALPAAPAAAPATVAAPVAPVATVPAAKAPSALPAAPTVAAPVAPTPPKKKSALQEILEKDDAPKAAPKPKESALKAILATNDVPKTTGEKSRMTDEEQKQIEADLKQLLDEVDKIDAELNANNKKKIQSPSKATNEVTEAKAAKTESLNVGAKDGKSIPWLVEIPGETPVEEKKDAEKKDDKKKAESKDDKKSDAKKTDEKKPEAKPAK